MVQRQQNVQQQNFSGKFRLLSGLQKRSGFWSFEARNASLLSTAEILFGKPLNNKRLSSSLTRAGSCTVLNWVHEKWERNLLLKKYKLHYCDFDGRGMCRQGKERNRISNRIRNKVYFLINQNVWKLQIILMSLSFKAEKKGKKARKEKRWFTAGKNGELWYSNLRRN